MITKLNHVSIFVLDQDSAFDFYVNKLGFSVHTDARMCEGMRWLTVCPPDQPEVELSLMAISEGMMFTNESAAAMRGLVKNGTFGYGAFECNDLVKTYEALREKGVEFKQLPTKEFYGFVAVLKDDSGNWFSLSEKEK